MKFSLNLAKQYIDLENITLDELCQKLSLAGFEVEEVLPMAQASHLVIGQVMSCENHPNSDHLHICKVNIGHEILQIVCGAPNVAVNQKVIVALVGAHLPAKDLIIKDGVIRDVPSHGMLCSLLELGVDESLLSEQQKNGIEILDENAQVGNEKVLEYLGLDDVMIDINVTPNRCDVLALNSLFIEMGAILNKKVTLPVIKDDFVGENPFTCNSLTPKCNYFSIRSIQGVKIQHSPKWMQEILQKHDIKSINNVVDIGNYVTLMTGQPLHMYDADQLLSKDFVVKDHYEESILALDNKEYEIHEDDIIVTNKNKGVCIAGVMGDASTMITENTRNIALEAALFDGFQILNSCKRYNLMTTAATNFSKKVVDEYKMAQASALAANLLVEYASAQFVSKINEYKFEEKQKKVIEITLGYINQYLDTNYTNQQVEEVFQRLQFQYELKEEVYFVTIPTYRNDMEHKQDLVEEIVRIIGFETVPFKMPVFETKEVGLTDTQIKRNIIKNYLLDNGLSETLSYTLISKSNALYYDIFDKEESVVLPHPLTVEKEYLRKNLVSSMLQTISYNQSRKIEEVAIFELSNVYSKQSQKEKLGIAISNGLNHTLHLKDREVNFYMMKGLVEGLLALFGIEASRYAFEELPKYLPNQNVFHPGKSAVLKINGQIMGYLGEIHPITLKKENISKTIYFELDLTKFMQLKTSKLKYTSVSKFPPIHRDIALVVKKDLPVIQILKTIKKAGGSLLQTVDVFDVYMGENIQEGYKSIALSMSFVDTTKTLQENDINEVFNKIYQACQKDCGAEIRK